MSMKSLHKLALRDTEIVTVTSMAETTGPGGRLVMGDGGTYLVRGLSIPIRNTALEHGYSAGGFEGEMRKFVFTEDALSEAGCQLGTQMKLSVEDGRYSIVSMETWQKLGLVVAYGKKLVR